MSQRSMVMPGLICLLLAGLTLAVYWPVTHCDFINYDDPGYFTENPHILGGLTSDNVLWAFRTGYLGNWFPLTWLSFMLDVTVFGPGPKGPHLVNLLLHAVNSVLLFLVLRRMTGSLWRSALVAALFALHPLRVESVAWVVERKDVLCGLFFLLTLWAYARYSEVQSPRSKVQSLQSRFTFHVLRFYVLALAFSTLGLMSKPMLVTLPCVLLLLDYWPLRRNAGCGVRSAEGPWRKLAWEKAPFFALSGIFCVATYLAQGRAGALVEVSDLSLAARVQNALVSYARYLGMTFWPVNLALPYPRVAQWPWAAIVLASLLVAALSLGAFWQTRERPYWLTGWFWFAGMLVPVIGLFQAGDQAMADRFTYLPAIGLLVALVWGGAELGTLMKLPKAVIWTGALVLLAACSLRTADQLRYWQNSEALFRHTLACTSQNVVACNQLGLALAAQGKWEEAVAPYQQALAIKPDYVYAQNNLADTLYALGRWDEAIEHYHRALQLDPTIAEAHNNIGLALGQKEQWAAAIPHYEQALATNPKLVGARKNLADALYALGQSEEAIRQYGLALQADPKFAEAHHNLSVVLRRQGREAEAAQHFALALKLDPNLGSNSVNASGARVRERAPSR